MNGTNGQACPECEAPRRPDGTPSCGCTRRASEAIRDARTAEAAAAEDFDPLRIRPYVDLGVTTSAAQAAVDETVQLVAVPQGAGAAPEGAQRPDTALPDTSAMPATSGAPDETMQLTALTQDGSRADGTGRPDETMQLGTLPAGADRAEGRPAAAPPDAAPTHRRRRRRTVVLAAGAAVATVVAAAGLASGLFSYDSPERNGALPEDVRASVPEQAAPDAASASASTASAPVAPASLPPSPSTSTSPPASPSTTPSATASTAPSRSATTESATDSPSPTSGDDGDNDPSQESLRHGDRGPGVTELQLRLRQVNLYFGPANGRYGNQVENAVRTYQFMRGIMQDEHGVYGPATRAKLESETSQP
ncbi:peptidoglycan-binding domain-containing protein [Streptomyces sp. NPDC004680]|uniref:peptidoglycan-binding domain-containing protein n=1 Tax=Streptomyces sp. NPDC004680 TaxID=3154287 RepID=UPI0033BD02F7